MSHKRWMRVAIAAATALVLNPVLAKTPLRVHAKNLGRASPAVLATHFQLSVGDELVAKKTISLGNGHALIRAQQFHEGVPVYGRSIAIERGPRGDVLRVNGTLEQQLANELGNVTPLLTPDQARLALQRALAQQGKRVRDTTAKLFVYPGKQQPARLVYRVSYLLDANRHTTRPTALVDANTGKVIRYWNGLTYGRRPSGGGAPVPALAIGPGGNGHTGEYYYDGSVPGHEKLLVTRIGNACYMENPDVATYDLAGGNSLTLWSFGCRGSDPSRWISSGDSINGGFSAINDAHHFAQVTHDMYEAWFNQPPLTNPDGTPMQLHLWVHDGSGFDNAYWDGSEMIFGDGNQDDYPVVALDIVGHEISHGFTEQHSELEYVNQSGGMNEAFSDMAGAAVAYFVHGENSNDFLIGEDIQKSTTAHASGTPYAWRDMCAPASNGHGIGHAADYYDGMDPHDASGVYNKAFCVLAKTSGWNIRKAFEVFHDANAVYWNPEATYASGACGVEQAATDRGYSKADVTAAFTAVGVTCDESSGGA